MKDQSTLSGVVSYDILSAVFQHLSDLHMDRILLLGEPALVREILALPLPPGRCRIVGWLDETGRALDMKGLPAEVYDDWGGGYDAVLLATVQKEPHLFRAARRAGFSPVFTLTGWKQFADEKRNEISHLLQTLRNSGCARVALAGGGLFATRLLQCRCLEAVVDVVCVIDQAGAGQSIAGVPVVQPDDERASELDAYIVASDTCADDLRAMLDRQGHQPALMFSKALVRDSGGRLKIMLFPPFASVGDYTDQYYRALWYLFPLAGQVSTIDMPVQAGAQLQPDVLPDMLDPSIKTLEGQLPIRAVPWDSPLACWTALQETDLSAILVWNRKAMQQERVWAECFAQRASQAMVWNIDSAEDRFAGSTYLKVSEAVIKDTRPHVESECQAKFERFASRVEQKGYRDAYVFGTGPSLERVMDMREPFDEGFSVACNSMLKNHALLDKIQPDVFVVADPVFHAGCSRYAAEFRGTLIEAMRRWQIPVLVPLRDYAVYLAHLPEDIHAGVIGVPFRQTSAFNYNLRQSFHVKPTRNILTIFCLPVASTFAQRIMIGGCDGRKLEENNYFWTHHKASQFVDKMDDVKRAHPSFFDIDYNEYYLDHCATLENYLREGECLGKVFENITKSYIPALQTRCRHDQQT